MIITICCNIICTNVVAYLINYTHFAFICQGSGADRQTFGDKTHFLSRLVLPDVKKMDKSQNADEALPVHMSYYLPNFCTN